MHVLAWCFILLSVYGPHPCLSLCLSSTLDSQNWAETIWNTKQPYEKIRTSVLTQNYEENPCFLVQVFEGTLHQISSLKTIHNCSLFQDTMNDYHLFFIYEVLTTIPMKMFPFFWSLRFSLFSQIHRRQLVEVSVITSSTFTASSNLTKGFTCNHY